MKKLAVLATLVAIILSVILPSFVLADVLVDGPDSSYSIYDRCTFRSQGLIWVFYYGSTGLSFKTSDDGGASWSSETTGLGSSSTSNFRYWYEENNERIHILGTRTTYGMYYRSGDLNVDGTVDWNASWYTVTTWSGPSASWNASSICTNENGYPFISYDTSSIYPTVRKSANNDGTWSTDWSHSFTSFGTSASMRLAPLGDSDEIYAILWGTSEIEGYRYTGSGSVWDSGQQIAANNILDGALVTVGDDVHVVYNDSTTNTINYRHRESGTYQTAVELVSSAEDPRAYVLDLSIAVTNQLYVTWGSDLDLTETYYLKGVNPYESDDWTSSSTLVSGYTQINRAIASYNDQPDDLLDYVFVDDDGSEYLYHTTKLTQWPLSVLADATDIEDTDVTLEGEILDDATTTIGDCYFEYGTSLLFGSETTHETGLEEGDSWTADLSSLSTYTTYYYRAAIEWTTLTDSGTYYSAAGSFRTLSGPPSCTTLGATSITSSSANMRGYLDEDGGGPCEVRFQWGTSSGIYTYESPWIGNVYETTTYPRAVYGLNPGTTYYYHFQIQNDGTSSPVSGGESAFTTLLDNPDVTTRPASRISVTTAILNAYISDDGGENCYVRFQYGLTDSYGTDTAWVYPYAEGASAYVQIEGLSVGTTYHFRAQIYNTNNGVLSPVSGADTTFTTASTLGAVTNLKATATSGTTILINWTLSAGSQSTLVRYKVGSYPSSTSDGEIAYFGEDTSYTLESLTPGVTYYFAAWGYAPDNYWSSTEDTAVATTSAYGAASVLIQNPSEPSWWFLNPSPDSITGMPGYGIIEWQAEELGVPIGSWCCIIAILAASFMAGMVIIWTRSSTMALITAATMCFAGAMAGLVPLWIMFAVIVMGTAIMYIVPAGRGAV